MRVIVLFAIALIFAAGVEAFAVSPKGVHPVLLPEVNEKCLLIGGAVDGKWVSAKEIAPKMTGTEHYKLYSSTGYLSTETATKPVRDDHWYMVEMWSMCYKARICVSGDWNAAPRRKITPVAVTQKVYQDEVRRILKAKGLGKSPANIESISRVDLEGDGKDEVIINAISKIYDSYTYRKGQYSFVALRKLVNGRAKTHILCGDFHTKNNSSTFPESYDGHALWDVDGDGALEINIDWTCHRADAAGIQLYDIKNNKPVLLVREAMGH